eukprot:jgi/Mesvir1/19713/Mv09973-RA.1
MDDVSVGDWAEVESGEREPWYGKIMARAAGGFRLHWLLRVENVREQRHPSSRLPDAHARHWVFVNGIDVVPLEAVREVGTTLFHRVVNRHLPTWVADGEETGQESKGRGKGGGAGGVAKGAAGARAVGARARAPAASYPGGTKRPAGSPVAGGSIQREGGSPPHKKGKVGADPDKASPGRLRPEAGSTRNELEDSKQAVAASAANTNPQVTAAIERDAPSLAQLLAGGAPPPFSSSLPVGGALPSGAISRGGDVGGGLLAMAVATGQRGMVSPYVRPTSVSPQSTGGGQRSPGLASVSARGQGSPSTIAADAERQRLREAVFDQAQRLCLPASKAPPSLVAPAPLLPPPSAALLATCGASPLMELPAAHWLEELLPPASEATGTEISVAAADAGGVVRECAVESSRSGGGARGRSRPTRGQARGAEGGEIAGSGVAGDGKDARLLEIRAGAAGGSAPANATLGDGRNGEAKGEGAGGQLSVRRATRVRPASGDPAVLTPTVAGGPSGLPLVTNLVEGRGKTASPPRARDGQVAENRGLSKPTLGLAGGVPCLLPGTGDGIGIAGTVAVGDSPPTASGAPTATLLGLRKHEDVVQMVLSMITSKAGKGGERGVAPRACHL